MKRTMIFILTALAFSAIAVLAADFSEQPFTEKLIFSETPEIGKKWHGGLRTTDLISYEGYLNINGWATVDFMLTGIFGLKMDSNGVELSDNFKILTFKSRPLCLTVKNAPYKLAGGLKIYRSDFNMVDESDSLIATNDRSTVLFLTQGYLLNNKHYFNLFTSLSSREKSGSTYYIVPGYRYRLSDRWNMGIEYYMTNTLYLPMKIFQFLFDKDKLDFFNTDRNMFSYMFYGFQYTGEHVRIDLNLASHVTFQYFIMPMIGFGWNF